MVDYDELWNCHQISPTAYSTVTETDKVEESDLLSAN